MFSSHFHSTSVNSGPQPTKAPRRGGNESPSNSNRNKKPRLPLDDHTPLSSLPLPSSMMQTLPGFHNFLSPLVVQSTFAAPPPRLDRLPSLDLAGVAEYIKRNQCRNIIVMTGAGVSVSAGIPDFRSPGTGLYDNLHKYNLPTPESVFDIHYFRMNPKPFYTLARELYPGNFKPTAAHHFIKLLHDRGLLLRNYTQNIDGLERIAGIPDKKLVEAHGTFSTARCIACRTPHSSEYVKARIFAGEMPHCVAPVMPKDSDDDQPAQLHVPCNGLVKPDIVFFGENLPARFHNMAPLDFPKCDLLLVMGTSLHVQPFAGLIDRVEDNVPRILVNLNPAGLSPKLHIRPLPAAELPTDSSEESDGGSSTPNPFQALDEDQAEDNTEEEEEGGVALDPAASPSSSVSSPPTTSPSTDSDADAAFIHSITQSQQPTPPSVDDDDESLPSPPTFRARAYLNVLDNGDHEVAIEEGAEHHPETQALIQNIREQLCQKGFRFHHDDNVRDVFVRGTTDDGVHQFAAHLGMLEELRSLLSSGSDTSSCSSFSQSSDDM